MDREFRQSNLPTKTHQAQLNIEQLPTERHDSSLLIRLRVEQFCIASGIVQKGDDPLYIFKQLVDILAD
jgi:hypothetical protein